MFRRIARGFALAALAALITACGSTTTTVVPTPVIVSETFIGTLIPASAGTFTFNTLTGGAVIASVTAIGPDNTKTVGFSLGSFNGAVCTIILDNGAAAQGFAFNASTSSIGTYCVRIYDNGSTTADNVPYTFTITVSHPQ
ncbi:MAG TPA: hypothetical protein VGI12_15815 [Vicinamibacterales bacterium]